MMYKAKYADLCRPWKTYFTRSYMLYVLAQLYDLPSEISHKSFRGSEFCFRYAVVCIKVEHWPSTQTLLWWDLEIPDFSQEIFLSPEKYTSCKTNYAGEFSLPLKQKSKTVSYHFLSKYRSVTSPSSRRSEEVASEVLILTMFYNNIIHCGQTIN